MLKYIELKSPNAEGARAWIARVRASKSGSTLYFDGKALKRAHLPSANHVDEVTGQGYWVASIRADESGRRWAGPGTIAIEAGAVAEYLRITGSAELDATRFHVIDDLAATAPEMEPHAARADG